METPSELCIISNLHFATLVNILPKLRYFVGRIYVNVKLKDSFSTFVFLIALQKVGTSWIFRNPRCMTPLTNYGSSTNVPIVGKDLMRAFYKLFYLQCCDSSDKRKKAV